MRADAHSVVLKSPRDLGKLLPMNVCALSFLGHYDQIICHLTCVVLIGLNSREEPVFRTCGRNENV